MEHSQQAVQDIKTQLEQLMCFAGIKLKLTKEHDDWSFSSTSDLENSREFMDNLQSVACRAVSAVTKLQHAVEDYKKSSSSLVNNTRSSRGLVSQWPRNCREYQEHLRLQGGERKTQKSLLRSSSVAPSEEKRVRFDISLTSQSSVNCSGDMDTVDV